MKLPVGWRGTFQWVLRLPSLPDSLKDLGNFKDFITCFLPWACPLEVTCGMSHQDTRWSRWEQITRMTVSEALA